MSKGLTKHFLLTIFLIGQLAAVEAKSDISDFLQTAKLEAAIREEIAELDVNFGIDLADLDLAQGVGLSTKYRYEVEPSYQNQYYTRIDKWDIKTNINVGDLLSNVIEAPLSFSINRQNSFFFVRQFKNKVEALSSMPYSPKRLPLNSKKALSELVPGDFVSIPANLNIAISAGASTSMPAPVMLEAHANIFYIISGEFTIQVFKIDNTHVRLKLISKRGYDRGATAGAGASFKLFGIRILDRQIDRLFDRDLVQLGYSINPGAQFIVDYVFDLANPEAALAYNQILGSTLKFKDVVVLNQLGDASELKDKLISSFEQAEKIFEADKVLSPAQRRVSRIFKGFNNYQGHTNHLKLALLLTSFVNDRTFTENKVTYIDKHENSMDFYYPSYSKYIETRLGKWFFELKDQSFQNNFGLIPRMNTEDSSKRAPDLGITFERRDKLFTSFEQRVIQKFLIGQMPTSLGKSINFDQWRSAAEKGDSRIFFQLILKSQGFNFLKDYSREQLREKLIAYVTQREKLKILDNSDSAWQSLKDFLFLSKHVKTKQLKKLADKIHATLKNTSNNSESMLRDFIKLNEDGIFDKIGVGFLISLLPQDELNNLIYVKLDMIARDLKPINYEFGRLNYRALYNELNEVQSRLSNRSYDLRITPEDHAHENMEIDEGQGLF